MRTPSAPASPALPLLPILLTVIASGCALTGPGDDDCYRGKCDGVSDVRSQLDGLDEPIADWLRASPMTRDGILETNYMAAMEQLARFSDCDIDTLKTYVLSDDLVEGQPFPRLISTLCSDDDSRAADLFVAASFSDPSNRDDVDPRNLEMFAWDRIQKRNVFYAMLPVEGSDTKVQVEVEPKRCEGCHRNGSDLDDVGMPMIPIMNELVTPWPHWNSEPDFPSHTFELPDRVKGAPTFSELTRGDRLGAAVDLEQIIKSAQTNRVISERLKVRREKPANVDQAMALLRPIFCDEQVNYATEDHGSNVLAINSVVAGGTREMYLAIRGSDWPWAWLNDNRLRFAASSTDPITMLPVRGNVDVEYVRRLVAVRAISAEQVLRVAALDWTRPVFSDLRCDLWKSARARLREDPPTIAPDSRNLALLPVLYDEIMMLDGEISLQVGDDLGADTTLVSLARAEDLGDLRNALEADKLDLASCTGDTGFCATSLDGLGDLIATRVSAVAATGGRDLLREDSASRYCVVRERFANRPALPPGSCDGRGRDSVPKSEAGLESASDVFLDPVAGTNRDIRLIPDGAPGGIASVISIANPSDHTIFAGFVRVRVQVDHSWRGDLDIRLRVPSGEEIPIARFDAGDSANDLDDVFTVFGLPADLMAAGDWTLISTDTASGERGHLLGWSIGINREAPSLEAPGARVAPR